MFAQFSKYDFWNLWKISVRHRKNPEQKFSFFSWRKSILKKQIQKNREIFDFFAHFEILLRNSYKETLSKISTFPKKSKISEIFRIDVFKIVFLYEKNENFCSGFFLYRTEIFQRFQKSYLENCAKLLNIRKNNKCKKKVFPDF